MAKSQPRIKGVEADPAALTSPSLSPATPTPLLVDVPTARKVLGGISEGKLRDLTKSGDLRPTRIGRRVFYRLADLETWAEQQALRS